MLCAASFQLGALCYTVMMRWSVLYCSKLYRATCHAVLYCVCGKIGNRKCLPPSRPVPTTVRCPLLWRVVTTGMFRALNSLPSVITASRDD